jgi:hypothetical protein
MIAPGYGSILVAGIMGEASFKKRSMFYNESFLFSVNEGNKYLINEKGKTAILC